MKTPIRFIFAALAVGSTLAEPACQATAHNAAEEFSLLSNPTGVWSYGSSSTLGGAMTLDGESYLDANGLAVWRETGSGANGPAFVYNPTTSPIVITGPSDLSIWNPHQLSMSPGSINMDYCVLRFTAPGTGSYQVQGAFSSVDHYYGATTDVHLVVNGVSIFDGMVLGVPSPAGFSQDVLLSTGDSLDFVVGFGSYGGGWDSTGLAATVTSVPEPAALGLLLPGLAMAAELRRRRVPARR